MKLEKDAFTRRKQRRRRTEGSDQRGEPVSEMTCGWSRPEQWPGPAMASTFSVRNIVT